MELPGNHLIAGLVGRHAGFDGKIFLIIKVK